MRIWRVKPPTPSEDLDPGAEEGDGAQWSASIVGDFDDHKSAVGRVEWNITGYVEFWLWGEVCWAGLTTARRTVLSSAGNDGRVRLWKMTAGNVWRPAGHISVEQAEEQQGDVDMGDVAVDD